MLTDADLRTLLDDLLAKYGNGSPGASIAVLRDGDLTAAATGVANVATGVEATTDTVFQIGSITKTWTATLAMSLVDEGRLELDTVVADVVPGLRLANDEATRAVTIRHLLTHTNGIDSDHLVDTGWGDDALERYVATLPDAEIAFPPGATWSYSNSGFALLGRVAEVLTGTTWDAALRDRVTAPLGLVRTTGRTEELLRHRVAYGHTVRDSVVDLAPIWSIPRSFAPAGATLCTSMPELVRYGEAHVRQTLLRPETHAAMTSKHVALPDPVAGEAWGLGWALWNWSGTPVFGHNGGTFSQMAALRVLPALGVVIAVAVNSRAADDGIFDAAFREILRGDGVEPPAPLEPVSDQVPDLAAHVGRYGRAGMTLEIARDDDRYVARLLLGEVFVQIFGTAVVELPLAAGPDGRVLTTMPGERAWRPIVFLEIAGGRRYAFMGQAMPKLD